LAAVLPDFPSYNHEVPKENFNAARCAIRAADILAPAGGLGGGEGALASAARRFDQLMLHVVRFMQIIVSSADILAEAGVVVAARALEHLLHRALIN
jgi:hypothetical protein